MIKEINNFFPNKHITHLELSTSHNFFLIGNEDNKVIIIIRYTYLIMNFLNYVYVYNYRMVIFLYS